MSQPAPATDVHAGIRTGAALCLAVVMIVAVVVAAGVRVTGLAEETRGALGFGFGGVERSPGEAASIALFNARLAAATLLCAVIAPHVTLPTRRAIFLLLCTVLMCCASALGIATGAYGTRFVRAVAIHGPVEFSAFALAGGAYMQACKQALTGRAVAAVAAATGLLLVVAAALETYVSIGGSR